MGRYFKQYDEMDEPRSIIVVDEQATLPKSLVEIEAALEKTHTEIMGIEDLIWWARDKMGGPPDPPLPDFLCQYYIARRLGLGRFLAVKPGFDCWLLIEFNNWPHGTTISVAHNNLKDALDSFLAPHPEPNPKVVTL